MTHLQKWTEVCEEMESKFPNDLRTLWISGYVFGLKHAATVCTSQNGVGAAMMKRTRTHTNRTAALLAERKEDDERK